MSDPEISVLMGTYYRHSNTVLLERSVQSVLMQSMVNFEFLICDDGSTERAKALLDEYAAKDLRIRLIRPGNKFSLPQKLNACLEYAKGEYIARMDDDDFSHLKRFEKQFNKLRDCPELAYIGCCVNLQIDDKIVGSRMLPEFPEVKDFYFTQPFIHPTLIFRKSSLLLVGGYSEDPCCELCEDYDLLLRLYSKGLRGMNLQEKLLDYSIPATEKGKRTIHHRWNETVTRYRRFRELNVLPAAIPYVIKPLIVGILPSACIAWIKNWRDKYFKL